MQQATITVRICSYNRPKFLREALISVQNQTAKPALIEIYDNHSSIETFDYIKDLIVDGVNWVPAASNIGGLANIERALHEALTKYVYVMHDDDRLLPHFVEQQIDYLEHNPDCAAVSCNASYIDTDGFKTAGQWHENNYPSRVFRSPRALAFHYAKGFLGFPSFVYRSQIANLLRFPVHLGKVADAGLIIEIAKFGTIAFQNKLLLEYRIHTGQDSEYFPELVVKSLYDHLKSFFSNQSRVNKYITELYRRRMKHTLLTNLIYRKSGFREVRWVLAQNDWKLAAICLFSVPVYLYRAYCLRRQTLKSIPSV